MISTKQQKRANFALEMIEKYKINETDKSFFVSMPNLILSNGLGQTIAYLASKKNMEDRLKAYKILMTYLCLRYDRFKGLDKNIDVKNITNQDLKFLKCFTECSQTEYVKMQEDVLRMLEWLKQYSRALCIKKGE